MTYVIAPVYGVTEVSNLRKELGRITGVTVLGGNERVGYKVRVSAKELENIKRSLDGRVTIDEFELMKPL